jgi:type I restriction enzyme R subunit
MTDIVDRYSGENGELNFENDFVEALQSAGWTDGVLEHCTVEQMTPFEPEHITSLEGNFRNILFENNRNTLNGVPLSDTEFEQIMLQVRACNTPVKANLFINGESVALTRDFDSSDTYHAGKTIFLNIFRNTHIAAGNSKYQIARQTHFLTDEDYQNRRGDITLLINGIPIIHIELKTRDVSIEDGIVQVTKYKKEGAFSGLMQLVQMYYSINPEEAVYYANYGDASKYNPDFIFHWADEKNVRINDIGTLILGGKKAMLSIPQAHEFIAYYTVADKEKDVLRVFRPYQYYAVNAIQERVKEWDATGNADQLGGIVWCTTGGGKTLTSFKAGQLLLDFGYADKVVFLVDRIELNNQSSENYDSFSREGESVVKTSSAKDLFAKLKDDGKALIVTSIQKMSKIDDSNEFGILKKNEYQKIKSKRLVFIVDEAHRSQLGDMHRRIKARFPNAIFFGFTGTPLMSDKEGDIHDSRLQFGEPIATYTIAQGIKDGNVLGFDPQPVLVKPEIDTRDAVARYVCKASSMSDINKDLEKKRLYTRYRYDVPMESIYIDKNGNKKKGIEAFLTDADFDEDYKTEVVLDIAKNFPLLSRGKYEDTQFHALFAVSSIEDAIIYYNLFKKHTGLHVTTVFDSSIDNTSTSELDKEDAIVNILHDYNNMFEKKFSLKTDPQLNDFKRDVVHRLAHTSHYENLDEDKYLDIVIVVRQLLTGFDSQFVNTLYLDKVLETNDLIQAISRTNRVYNGAEKPFGIIRFYRKPYTMLQNLKKALELYCEGDKTGVIVDSATENITELNRLFADIFNIFKKESIPNFIHLPQNTAYRNKFHKLFQQMKKRINAAELIGGLQEVIQDDGSKVFELKYVDDTETSAPKETPRNKVEQGLKLDFTYDTYKILTLRNKELEKKTSASRTSKDHPSFIIPTAITELQADKIDAEYLEKNFKDIVPQLVDKDVSEEHKDALLKEFSDNLGYLTEYKQRYAFKVVSDVRNGKLVVDGTKSLLDYIFIYIGRNQEKAIKDVSSRYGIDEAMLRELLRISPRDSKELYSEGRFQKLRDTCDITKVKSYYEEDEGCALMDMEEDLQTFILEDFANV